MTLFNAANPARRAFTLLELLVAIIIIAILVAIVGAVGFKALDSQKDSTVRGVFGSLDRALDEYKLAKGSFPRYLPDQYVNRPGTAWNLDSGGVPDTGNNIGGPGFGLHPASTLQHPKKPTAGVFFSQAKAVGQCDEALKGLPSDVVKITPKRTNDGQFNPADPAAVTLLDPWAASDWELAVSGGQKAYPAVRQSFILYVHPDNVLAQALYGKCVNNRPYFLSGGRDRRVGLKDEQDPKAGGEDDAAYKRRIEGALTDNLTSYPVGPADTTQPFFDAQR